MDRKEISKMMDFLKMEKRMFDVIKDIAKEKDLLCLQVWLIGRYEQISFDLGEVTKIINKSK